MNAAQNETGARKESKKKVITADDVRGDVPLKHVGPPGPPGGAGA